MFWTVMLAAFAICAASATVMLLALFACLLSRSCQEWVMGSVGPVAGFSDSTREGSMPPRPEADGRARPVNLRVEALVE